MKSKIILFFLVCTILFINSSFSQSQFGISGGLQMSHMSGFQDNPKGYLASLQIKLLTISPVSDDVVLIPSLGYSGKGYKWNNLDLTDQMGNSLGTGDIIGLFNYVQLSIPICYKISTKQHSQFYIGAGPYFSYALSGKGRLKNAAVAPNEESWNLFEADNYKKTDAGAVIQFASTLNRRYLAAVNIDIGLMNLNNGAGNKLKNMAAGISIGYIF